MQGARLITLFEKRQFEFTFLTAPSGTVTTILERALPVIPDYYLWVGIRVHARDIGGGNMVIEGFNTLPSDEDPAEFTSIAAPSLSITINSSTIAPSLQIATATAMGPMVKFSLRATAGATAGKLYAELSGAVYGRPA